jgi:hypothetical protein
MQDWFQKKDAHLKPLVDSGKGNTLPSRSPRVEKLA